MTFELMILIWACVLGLVHVLLSPLVSFATPGYVQWNAGPRDKPFETPIAAQRLDRAFNNFKETFVFFAVIVIALALAHRSTPLSVAGAQIYLVARVVYIPLYITGVKGVRSLAWVVSLLGIFLCLISLFI
jgi:uncharacterized MAPEG superfamily protein